MTKDMDKLNYLLEEGKSRRLTKDEITTLFNITRKRIREIEQKAANRLRNSKSAKEN